MHELGLLLVTVVVIMAATTVMVGWLGPALLLLEKMLLAMSIALILFAMLFISAEVVMRYLFNAPIPGHLEGSELLVPMIVFLALSSTQATHGHVGMDLMLDALSPRWRRYAEMGTLLVSILVCAVLAYFSCKLAYQLWLYDDVTMTPPYFRTWPSAACITLGYALISVRMYVQVLNVYDPDRFPAYEPANDGGHHLAE